MSANVAALRSVGIEDGEPPRSRRLRLRGTGLLGAVLVGLVVLAAIAEPLIAPHDYAEQQLSKALLPPFWQSGAEVAYPLGTDHLGRDILSRIVFGARTGLLGGAAGVVIAGAMGSCSAWSAATRGAGSTT